MAQQGHLRLATGLTVETTKRAIGQCLGNGKHGLERRHGLVAPQRLEHVRDHARHVLKPVLVARRFTRAPHLALHALQQALDARSGLAARQSHVLIEGTGIDGISARKRTVNPVGKLRRGPPLSLRSCPFVGGLHTLDQVGERRELPARNGLRKRRELSRLGRNVTRRQTGSEFTEQLGSPGGNHEHARGVRGRRDIAVDRGVLTRFYQLINCIHIGVGAGVRAGNLYKGRLSGGLGGSLGRGGTLPQRRGLKQHTAGIKGGSQIFAHCRLLAGKQHNDLSPIVRHGRQQLEQAVRKRRDTAHAYGAGARRQVIGQGIGHNVSRLAGLDHISTVQTARIGAQKFKHASLGVAFGLGLANVVAATLGACPCHTRQHIASHTREHTHRALAARKRLQVGVVEARYHVRKQHLALQVVDETAPVAQKFPKRAKPRCRRLVVNTQRNAGFRRIMTAQVELSKRWRQQHGTPVAGNKVGKQRRLGIAQIRAGVGGIDSNRHGPPLKPFAIFNVSILPARADRFAPRQQISSVPEGSKNRPRRDGSAQFVCCRWPTRHPPV